jgi:hypothetical protein
MDCNDQVKRSTTRRVAGDDTRLRSHRSKSQEMFDRMKENQTKSSQGALCLVSGDVSWPAWDRCHEHTVEVAVSRPHIAAGGAGGSTTYEALKKADEAWQKLRTAVVTAWTGMRIPQ